LVYENNRVIEYQLENFCLKNSLRAAVPEFTAIAYLAPTYLANSSPYSAILGP